MCLQTVVRRCGAQTTHGQTNARGEAIAIACRRSHGAKSRPEVAPAWRASKPEAFGNVSGFLGVFSAR